VWTSLNMPIAETKCRSTPGWHRESHRLHRLVVSVVLVLGATECWAQTNSRATQYVTTINQGAASLQPQNPFVGSVPAGKSSPATLQLSLGEAIDRALKQNLGVLLASEGIGSARGVWWKSLSELLPNIATSTSFSARQINLQTVGINLSGLRKFASIAVPLRCVHAKARPGTEPCSQSSFLPMEL